jgi:hypothetical protein
MNTLFINQSEPIKHIMVSMIILSFCVTGCGAVSTSGRYETSDTKKETTEVEDKTAHKDQAGEETFDITPFRPEINLESTEFMSESYTESGDAWYEYAEKIESTKNKKIISTEDGFRVQIIATDNLEEANRVNTDISSLIPNHRTYVNFEPPFYKVKLGDFRENYEASDMRFRLSQMGYTESKVVRETINIFD